MEKHFCKIENGRVFYKRNEVPSFVAEAKYNSVDKCWHIDDNTIIEWPDNYGNNPMAIAMVMREAGDFIAEFIKANNIRPQIHPNG